MHGPVLKENLNYYLNLYDIWSKYEAEEKGVVIAYSSIYGNTKRCVELLAEELVRKREKVSLIDLAKMDMSYAIKEAFRYDRLVLASVTYNNDIFPHMNTFIHGLIERNYQNRKVGLIQNGSWAPSSAKVMKCMLSELLNVNIIDKIVTINSSMNIDNINEIKELANTLSE